MAETLEHAPSHVIMSYLVILCQTVRTYVWKMVLSHHAFQGHSKSMDPKQTTTVPFFKLQNQPKRGRNSKHASDTYNLLIVIHINHGPMSYPLRDKWRFQSKHAIFPAPYT